MVVAHALPAGDVIWIESVARAAGARDALTMHLIRIDHVSLDVHDRPASIAWYEEVLGLRAHACHRVADEPGFLGPAAIIRGRRSVGVSPRSAATDSAMIASKRPIRWRSWAAIDSYSEHRRWRMASRSSSASSSAGLSRRLPRLSIEGPEPRPQEG